MTCSRVAHDLFMGGSWLIHGWFMTCSWVVHSLFVGGSSRYIHAMAY